MRGAKTSSTPTLAKVSNKSGFAYLSIRLHCKISRLSVFSYFFHEVRHHKVRKVTDLGLQKQIQIRSESSKSPKNDPKMRFLGFW